MKDRCYRHKNNQYKDYGGRGISVCDEWLNNFQAFYDWAMSHGYKEELTIDRIDNNGNYEPSNCRWATRKEQNNNTRRNRRVEFNNESHTVKEWCDMLGITQSVFYHRLARGWTVEEALTGNKGVV
jgi:hypothetical protein